MSCDYELTIFEKHVTFVYDDRNILFEFDDGCLELSIFDGSRKVFEKLFGSDGNVFYQNERLFDYLPWNVFEHMRRIAIKHCGDGYTNTDYFIHLDGPRDRMRELDLSVAIHSYTSEWIELELYYPDTFTNYCEDLGKIWRNKQNTSNLADEELNKEYQYIVDNIFTSF